MADDVDDLAADRSLGEQPTEVMPLLPADPPPRKRRRLIVLGVVAVCVVAGIGTVIVLHGKGTSTTTPPAPVYTARVVRTNLANTQSVAGTIGYGTAQTVQAGAGTVTWLPAVGAVISRNQQLLRVDDQPVFLFYGATPMFRDLATPNLVGEDVRMVADNLSALGYAIGAQPRVGTMIAQTTTSSPASAGTARGSSGGLSPTASPGAPTASSPVPSPASSAQQPAAVRVNDGDAVLTPSLINAIRRWQRDAGQPQTGVLGKENVIEEPGPVRIGAVPGQLGGSAAVPLLSVTGTTKVITVPVDPSAVGPVDQGATVSLQLPSGQTVPGTVTSVITPSAGSSDRSSGGADSAESGSGSAGSSGTITVTVTPNDPASVAGLDSGSVQVVFTTDSRDGVLAVPVGALLALREGGYAVQVPGRGLVAVTTGMFARGMVQISGPGIAAGTMVVTTP